MILLEFARRIPRVGERYAINLELKAGFSGAVIRLVTSQDGAVMLIIYNKPDYAVLGK